MKEKNRHGRCLGGHDLRNFEPRKWLKFEDIDKSIRELRAMFKQHPQWFEVPKPKSDKLKIHDESPIHLTEEGLNHLREKLVHLEGSLPDLIVETQRTAAYGDRSDNAEYKEAKAVLRRTYRQILSTKDLIKRSVIIKSGLNAHDKVQLGSTVVLDRDGVQQTFQIVGPRETNPAKGRISHQSPLGAALVNHVKGDTVKIHPPIGGGGGSQTYHILEIR